MVQEALNAVCESFDGCEMLAYADLSTQLVLAHNESADQTRDTMNELCAEANVILKDGFVGVVGTQTGFRLFLRDANEPSDGLICICGLTTDFDKLLPAAQKCLADISAGGDDA